MNEKRRKALVKYIALTGIVISFFPAILAVRLAFFGNSGRLSESLLLAGAVVVGLIVGFLSGDGKYRLFKKLKPDDGLSAVPRIKMSRESALRLVLFLTLIVCALAVFLGNIRVGVVKALFEAVTASILYSIGARVRFGYARILNSAMLGLCIALIGVPVFFMLCLNWYANLKGMFFWTGYLFMASAMIVKNQERIDRAFMKGDREVYTIPKSIRKYNTGVLVIVFTFIMLLLNFKWIILRIFNAAGVMLKAVMGFVYRLMALLVMSKEADGGGGAQGNPDYSAMAKGGEQGIIATIIFTIIAILAVIIATRFIIMQIRKMDLSFLRKLMSRLWRSSGEEIKDYVDEIEIIKSEDSFEKSSKFKKRNIKKELKKITDPVEKVRYLYSLVIRALVDKSVDIQRSDTTGEIVVKAGQAAGAFEHARSATLVYDRVKYADEIPDEEEVSRVSESFRKLSEMHKKK